MRKKGILCAATRREVDGGWGVVKREVEGLRREGVQRRSFQDVRHRKTSEAKRSIALYTSSCALKNM